MAAMIQTYPQQTSTATMLQTRPSSATGMLPGSQNRQGNQYGQTSRASSYNNVPTGYRGSSGPVQPRSFNQLNHNMQWQQYTAYRANSSSSVPTINSYDPTGQYRGHANASPGYNFNFTPSNTATHDDSAIARSFTGQQSPYYNANANGKTVPDRYRRANAQAAQHNRSQSTNLPANAGMYQLQNGSLSVPNLNGSAPSLDDGSFASRAAQEEAMRLRRRSVNSLDTMDYPQAVPAIRPPSTGRPSSAAGRQQTTGAANLAPATVVHSRNGSSESISSNRSTSSRPSSVSFLPNSETPCQPQYFLACGVVANRDDMQANRSTPPPTGTPSFPADNAPKTEQAKQLSVPAHATSADASKRAHSPSPLSKPATMASESAESRPATSSGSPGPKLDSPAAKHLAAINQKGTKAKSKTSRLRRAFSFGSAAELRRVNEEETAEPSSPTKLHKEPSAEQVYDAEQARIAEAQEAGGIGNSIYGSRFFGSTDNLSISSTASSASVMIRKMGRGMKKSTRSLVGLFRPKSVIGVPSAEAPVPEVSQAEVSMITVEAETQRVNVTADPITTNGVTGFPHLERNSLDASHVPEMIPERVGSVDNHQTGPRRSIVGGDKERAEVLAAVRKGILKRKSRPNDSEEIQTTNSPQDQALLAPRRDPMSWHLPSSFCLRFLPWAILPSLARQARQTTMPRAIEGPGLSLLVRKITS